MIDPPPDLTGLLIAMDGDSPLTLGFAARTGLVFPLFSTEARLVAFLDAGRIAWTRIRAITDPAAFWAAVPRVADGQRIHFALDPHWLDGGQIRYRKLHRPRPGPES